MVTRRPSLCFAALLLSLARLDGSLAQRDTAAAHRALLQFNASAANDVQSVVAGVSTVLSDAVDAVASRLRFPTATPRSSSQAPQATPAPAVTIVVTPDPPTATTAAPVNTLAPTDTTPPVLETTGEPTPAAPVTEPPPPATEPPATEPPPPATEPPATAAPDTPAPTGVVEATPAPTDAPATPAPPSTDTPTPAPQHPQLDAASKAGSGNGADLEANVVSVMPSPVPSATPATAAPAVPSVAPVAAAPLPAAVPLPPQQPATVRDSTASSSSSALDGAGQVHAPHYSGSMAYALRTVGKNASDPSSLAPSKRPKKALKATGATGSGSQATSSTPPTSIENSSTSSGAIYNLGASSILSIVGVIVGICAIVGLFVVISRKKYGDDSDDDELPMTYGYRIDGGSVVRLSPTFLQNGESSMIGGNSYGPGASAVYDVDNTSSSGESGEEKVPYFGSSYGFDNYLATSHMMKSVYGGGPPAIGSSRRSSALLASDLKSSIYSSEASEGSETWSSVMASECDQGPVSRCTRDTTLSAITMPTNSETNCRATGNSRSTYGEALSEVNFDTSSNYRSTGASSVYRDESVAFAPSSPSLSTLSDSKSSDASSAFYRSSGRSTGISDYDVRSTGARSSIYSVGDPSPFDV